jgi:hypothetical protein
MSMEVVVHLFTGSTRSQLSSAHGGKGHTSLVAQVFSKDKYESIPDHLLQSQLKVCFPVGDLGCLAIGQAPPARHNIEVFEMRAVRDWGPADLWAIHIADFVLVGAEQAPQLDIDAKHIKQFADGLQTGILGRLRARMGMAGGFGAGSGDRG